MDIIQHSKKFTDSEVRQLNYCRLFLNAITLSDITHTTGTRLDGNSKAIPQYTIALGLETVFTKNGHRTKNGNSGAVRPGCGATRTGIYTKHWVPGSSIQKNNVCDTVPTSKPTVAWLKMFIFGPRLDPSTFSASRHSTNGILKNPCSLALGMIFPTTSSQWKLGPDQTVSGD
jgi:hypothetical protein